MLKRLSALFILGFTLGACDNMSQLEYDAKVQECYVLDRVEGSKVVTKDGSVYKLYSNELDAELSKGKTVCGKFRGAYRNRNDYFDIIHIGEEAERVQDYQKYLKELEVNNAKQTNVE